MARLCLLQELFPRQIGLLTAPKYSRHSDLPRRWHHAGRMRFCRAAHLHLEPRARLDPSQHTPLATQAGGSSLGAVAGAGQLMGTLPGHVGKGSFLAGLEARRVGHSLMLGAGRTRTGWGRYRTAPRGVCQRRRDVLAGGVPQGLTPPGGRSPGAADAASVLRARSPSGGDSSSSEDAGEDSP